MSQPTEPQWLPTEENVQSLITSEEEAAALPQWVEMRDAANPANLAGWHGPVQGYPNHIPPWTPEQLCSFPGGHMSTSVRPEASWAHVCREIDIEKLSAVPADIGPFIMMREHLGHKDGGAYFSLDRWPDVEPQLAAYRITPERIRLRIADWNGKPQVFSLKGTLGMYVSWAHQFENAGPYDRSAVFGVRDFIHCP